MRNGHGGAHRATRNGIGKRRRLRRPIAAVAVIATVIGTLVAGSGLAGATQATGHDAAVWANGWSWTYATTFHYTNSDDDVTLNESVAYTNAGATTYNGESAYKINLSGSITGCSGTAVAGGVTASLGSCSGSVSGTEYIRRADLALLQEQQHQTLSGKASYSIFSVGISATVDLTLSPNPGWRTEDFPLNSGDHWSENEAIAYNGGFSYDAGSFGSGSSPFNGTMNVNGSANVSSQTINPGIGSVATDYVAASSSDGSTVDNQWWAPTYANLAKEHMVAPLDGATLTIDRNLSAASTPAPGTTLTETITPSPTCAGGQVAVSGRLSSGASGVNLTVSLAQQAIPSAQQQSVTVTTGANGVYGATLTSPWASDGLAKNGSRGNWGVLVDGGGASQVATLVVTPADCTTLTYTGDASGPQGGTATVTAQLGDVGNPSAASGKTVTFSLSGGGSVNATTNSSGVATATLQIAGPPRAATISASFAGSGTQTSASASAAFTVTTDPTSTSVVANPPSATIGDPITFTATVTPEVGSGPTGTVQFVVDGQNFGAPVALTGGTATSAQLSTLGLGTHTVVANYSGDANFAPSSSPTVTFKVHNPLLPSTTTVALSGSTAVYGQQVTATATVAPKSGTGDPTGTVTFTDGSTTLGTANVQNGTNGDQATLVLPPLGVGPHNIQATYSGDDTYSASSGAASLTVSQAGTTVTLSTPDSSTVTGQSVSYTATVAAVAPGAGTPTGSAILRVDGNVVGDPVVLDNGIAVFPALTTLTAGAHSISATYSGDADFGGSTGTATQNVAPADTSTTVTASPSPSIEGQDVTISATVSATAPGSGNPTGTVSFTSDGDPIGAATLDSSTGTAQASITVNSLAAGSHSIVATYAGDDNYNSSTSAAITQKVISGEAQVATTTTLVSSTDPSTYGQLISFTATVAAPDSELGTPKGTVTFSVDGVTIGDPVPVAGDGTATSVTLASPEPGDHTVIAAYDPDAGFAASGATITQTVTDASVTTTLSSSDASSSYGEGVTFTATVTSNQVGTGAPTGVVQFRVDGQPLGGAVTLDGGTATSPAISTLTPGAHTVTVLYSGDTHFLPDTASLQQQVGRIATSTSLAVSSSNPTYGDPVTLTATVTPATSLGAPTGTVTFADGSTTLGTVPVAANGADGTASLTVATLHGGTHSITATYSGDGTYAPSSSAARSVVVQRAATTLYARPALVRLLPLGLPLGMLRGELSTAAGPLGGVPLTFSIAGKTVCTTNTDPDGHADCNARPELVQLTLALGYDVTFAGNGDYLPSTAHGTIIK